MENEQEKSQRLIILELLQHLEKEKAKYTNMLQTQTLTDEHKHHIEREIESLTLHAESLKYCTEPK
jgi:hypothetical protein